MATFHSHLVLTIIGAILLLSFFCSIECSLRKQNEIHMNSLGTEEEFAFAQITDIHIGDANSTLRLQNAVNQINQMVKNKQKNIKWVFATGDLTSSAIHNQFETCKKILDQLIVPYVPMIGNHDIWSYNHTWEETLPTGDLFFGKLFADKFDEVKRLLGDGFDYNNKSVPNPEHNNILSWFHNFELQVNDKLIILGLDFNSRKHALKELGYKGSWPGSELHDFPGGTLQWLEAKLLEIQKRGYDGKKIVLLQHHPYRCPFYVPDFIYSFSHDQKSRIRDILAKYLPIDRYWGHFAGHFHRWHEGPAFDESEWQSFYQWETCACKIDGSFAVANVKNGNEIVNIEKHIAGPSTTI
jgi:predicted MPP superfamily phosphohydrolase